eukprot:scaffold1130_cov195-Pinguiococcus_pyrenoidosus.AAC.35
MRCHHLQHHILALVLRSRLHTQRRFQLALGRRPLRRCAAHSRQAAGAPAVGAPDAGTHDGLEVFQGAQVLSLQHLQHEVHLLLVLHMLAPLESPLPSPACRVGLRYKVQRQLELAAHLTVRCPQGIPSRRDVTLREPQREQRCGVAPLKSRSPCGSARRGRKRLAFQQGAAPWPSAACVLWLASSSVASHTGSRHRLSRPVALRTWTLSTPATPLSSKAAQRRSRCASASKASTIRTMSVSAFGVLSASHRSTGCAGCTTSVSKATSALPSASPPESSMQALRVGSCARSSTAQRNGTRNAWLKTGEAPLSKLVCT